MEQRPYPVTESRKSNDNNSPRQRTQSRSIWITSVVLLSALASPDEGLAAGLSDFVGTWNIANLSVPSRLTLDRNTNGVVVALREGNNFENSTGIVVVAPDGTVSGNTPKPFRATASPGAQGEVILRPSDGSGRSSIIYQANASADLMVASGSFGDGYQDLTLCLRAPASLALADVVGSWNIVGIQTPTRLLLLTNQSGQGTGIDGLAAFASYTGTLNVQADGKLIGVSQRPFTGNVLGSGVGTVAVTIAGGGGGSRAHTLFVNAAKDMMVLLKGSSNPADISQELMLFLKTPAGVAPSDPASFWRIATFDTPRLTELRTPQGLLVGLSGTEGFGTARQAFTCGHDGFFTAVGGTTVSGTLTPGSGGVVTANIQTPDGPSSRGLRINSGQDIMATVSTHEWGQELMLMTRAPASTGTNGAAREFGMIISRVMSGITVEWAADVNTVLQTSGNLRDWRAVPDTIGRHAFTDAATNTVPTFFRVAQP